MYEGCENYSLGNLQRATLWCFSTEEYKFKRLSLKYNISVNNNTSLNAFISPLIRYDKGLAIIIITTQLKRCMPTNLQIDVLYSR